MPWTLLGNEIKKIRKSRKISQIRLAEGICHQSEISRIESGKTLPNSDILYGIAKKLNLNLDYWLKFIVSEESKEQRKFRDKLERITERKNYEELYEITEKELHNKYDIEFQQYLLWKNNIAAFELRKISFEEFNENLNEILNMNYISTEYHQDIHILNALAISNVKIGNIEVAIQYFQQSEKPNEENDLDEFTNKKEEEERRKKELDLLYRFSFSMAQLIESPENIDQVKIRLVQDPPVPFSKRNDKSFKQDSTYVEFGWQNFEYVVGIN